MKSRIILVEYPYGLGKELVNGLTKDNSLLDLQSIHLNSEETLTVFNEMARHINGKFILDTGHISNMVYDVVLNGLDISHVMYNIRYLKELSKIVDLEIRLVNTLANKGGYSDCDIELTEGQYNHIIELFDYIYDSIDFIPKMKIYKEIK